MTLPLSTVDVAEVVWLLIAAAGLVLALESLHVAQADRRLVDERERRHEASTREIELERGLADSDVAGARWVVLFEAVCIVIGVIAAARESHGRTLTGWVLVALLIVAAAAVPLRTFGQRRRRRRLLRGRRAGD